MSIAVALALGVIVYGAYMLLLSKRSAANRMGRSGPGIRIAETIKCEHTWEVAQQVAAPIYRLIAMYLFAIAALCLALGFWNGVVAAIVTMVLTIGVQVFFLGVASVRARKAAAAVRCEHNPAVAAPRATPPHRRKKKRR